MTYIIKKVLRTIHTLNGAVRCKIKRNTYFSQFKKCINFYEPFINCSSFCRSTLKRSVCRSSGFCTPNFIAIARMSLQSLSIEEISLCVSLGAPPPPGGPEGSGRELRLPTTETGVALPLAIAVTSGPVG